MNEEKRKALEAAGFVLEDAEDFLGLTAEEVARLDAKFGWKAGDVTIKQPPEKGKP